MPTTTMGPTPWLFSLVASSAVWLSGIQRAVLRKVSTTKRCAHIFSHLELVVDAAQFSHRLRCVRTSRLVRVKFTQAGRSTVQRLQDGDHNRHLTRRTSTIYTREGRQQFLASHKKTRQLLILLSALQENLRRSVLRGDSAELPHKINREILPGNSSNHLFSPSPEPEARLAAEATRNGQPNFQKSP